ncbi:MAG: hypothetical protein PHX93_00035 [Candidatus Peribacteraceae bacterium]|nr:hypothetical protein [Candidatus Peribacteraceae bacterium]
MSDHPTDQGPDASDRPVDPDFASLAREFSSKDDRPARRRGEWSGTALWDDTKIVRLLPGDVQGESGVEGVYQRSLLPIEMITAIQQGRLREYQQALREREEQRGGMLHDFNTQPLRRKNPKTKVPSICEQIRGDLEAALEMQSGASVEEDGKIRSIYEGRAVVPREEPRKILAWGTYSRSQILYIAKRTPDRDQHVAQLHAVLEDLVLDKGVSQPKLEESAGSTILFDTLNADPDAPGAASLLFCHLCSLWLRDGYTRILLWRHKGLQMVDLVEEGGRKTCKVDDAAVPQGNNDASYDFFRRRGFSDIGTRYSCHLAPRDYMQNEKVYPGYVLSTEGWMAGNLGQVKSLSSEIDKETHARYEGIV